MMIVWMLYSTFIACLVVVAARAAEWLARLAGYHVRWIWAGALALAMFLSASAVVREARPLPDVQSNTIAVVEAPHADAVAPWRRALSRRIAMLRGSVDGSLLGALGTVRRAATPTANVFAASLSSVVSVGLVLVLVGVGRRFRSARREWPLVTMQGVVVRVAPRIGPVVLGLVRPEIVVPRWLLARHAEDQRLVVTHEDEHVRAHDPLLLGLAWAAVIIAPWNPALWYMLSRLRLAVELDCDARVLRRGAAPRSYGTLLIDVAQHASALRLSALSLADDSSHLHQRILAMKPRVPRFARLRGGFAAVFALTGVVVACQATLPTDAEIEQMDVAAATRTARELSGTSHADTGVAYTLDGVKATTSEVSALAASELGKVQIVTSPRGTPAVINILTQRSAQGAAAGDSGRMRRTALMRNGTAGETTTVPELKPLWTASKVAFTGQIFIDGVRATEAQLRQLGRDQIESVDVLKGAYAAQLYNDPEAAKGVILIKTKGGRG